MQTNAMLNQLGYIPNDILKQQLQRIKNNTTSYEKIEKHIVDLNDALKPFSGYVAMSNSHDYLKIKLEQTNDVLKQKALQKIQHFSKKFKVALKKVADKDTFYILGFK